MELNQRRSERSFHLQSTSFIKQTRRDNFVAWPPARAPWPIAFALIRRRRRWRDVCDSVTSDSHVRAQRANAPLLIVFCPPRRIHFRMLSSSAKFCVLYFIVIFSFSFSGAFCRRERWPLSLPAWPPFAAAFRVPTECQFIQAFAN